MPKTVFSEHYPLLLELLTTTRKEAGMSQVELATRLGRPQPFVSYFERGERRIDVIEFYAIMRALGADPEREFRKLVAKLPKRLMI